MRSLCLRLPGTDEIVTWGHPTFRVGGRSFAVLEEYRGRLCVVFKTTLLEQRRLVRSERFFTAPYIGKHGWVSMIVGGRASDRELKRLLARSYRLVAGPTERALPRKPARRTPRNLI